MGAVAVFAIARKLAILVYRMLRYGQDYVDIGEQAYEAQFQHRRPASPYISRIGPEKAALFGIKRLTINVQKPKRRRPL